MKLYVLMALGAYVLFVLAMFLVNLWVMYAGPLAYEAPLVPGTWSAIGAGSAIAVMLAIQDQK
jgi:hypothetical protein